MEFIDRVSAYPNRYLMTTEDGKASYVVIERADEPITVGTPLNAETFNSLGKTLSEDQYGTAFPENPTVGQFYLLKL